MATLSSPRQAAPPTPQEISKKLSISRKPTKKPSLPISPSIANQYSYSGNESDSDSLLTPDISNSSFGQAASSIPPISLSNPPLTAIAEARGPSSGGEETDEDEDEGEGGVWRTAEKQEGEHDVEIKSGYLSKKGARRKTWKKRWFVLRPLHLAYYKTSAEYKLLRLLDLSDIHAVTPCALKRHTYTFGLVSPSRTFYLQASSQQELDSWVAALNDVREALTATATVTSLEAPTPPIPIPSPRVSQSSGAGTIPMGSVATASSSSPLSRRSHSPGHYVTSSDDEDTPSPQTISPPPIASMATSPTKLTAAGSLKDPTKIVLEGYLMKCGHKRRNWRKRWFVLSGQKLTYSGSHFDKKPHRQIGLEQILDALEYEEQTATGSSTGGHNNFPSFGSEETDPKRMFKIVTTKRSLLLSAPSETEEIKWLS